MREVSFIQQNRQKWKEIEQIIGNKIHKNPDDLSSIYINLINDLAYSQTYYPKSKTTDYLNFLSAMIFHRIYKVKRTNYQRFFYFFKIEIPLLMHQYRRYVLYSFFFFFLFVFIGVFSSHLNPNFVNLILGDGYVNMTIENIKDNNEVGVYQDESMLEMSIRIILNNLKVGATLFTMGVFGGVGSLWILMKNSIMVGTFQYLFYQFGGVSSLGESARGIWIHGTFEIFSMIIEAAAGLILGASLLFPKTYSRLDSFKIGAKNAFKIFASTMPFTIIAGFLEGFVTRFALIFPFWLNWVLIIGMFGFLVYYYLIYPFILNKHLNGKIN